MADERPVEARNEDTEKTSSSGFDSKAAESPPPSYSASSFPINMATEKTTNSTNVDADKTSSSEEVLASTGSELPPTKTPLPSHSTLAMSNYPPWWEPSQKRSPPAQKDPKLEAGAPLSVLKSVQSSTDKEERRAGKRYNEKDPSDKHQYLRERDWPLSSHARLNIFGRDVGGLGKPPSLGLGSFGRRKK